MTHSPAFIPAANRTSRQHRNWTEQNAKYVFLMPAILYLLVLGVFPLIFSAYLVFSSWQAGSGITFVGLDNIKRILVDDRFWSAVSRTLVYVALAAGLELLFGLLIALSLQAATRGKALLRLTLALPILLPPIAISFAWKMLFDFNRGPVNYFLDVMGLPPVLWLAGQTSALMSLVVVDVWQWTPFVALATLAALESLSIEIYEAAVVDGAGVWDVLRDITLPLLAPYLVAIVLLRAIDAFKVFDTVYVLTGGGPGTATELLSFYAYAAGFRTFNMGFTATVAWAIVILMSIIFFFYLRAFRRIEEM